MRANLSSDGRFVLAMYALGVIVGLLLGIAIGVQIQRVVVCG